MSCPSCVEEELKQLLENVESCNCNETSNSIFSTFESIVEPDCPVDDFVIEENIESCGCPKEPEFIRVCKTNFVDFNSDIFNVYLDKMNNEKVCGGYHKIKHITNLINTTNKEKENESLCNCEEN